MMCAVPSIGRMGKVQGSSCQGKEDWSQGGQGLAQPSCAISSSGQTGLSSQAAQCCLQGHSQETPFPAQSSPGVAPGLSPPLVPHLTKARPCCHEPGKGSFYLPPPPAGRRQPPCLGVPLCPGRCWAVIPGARQSQATGDITLWEGGTHSHSDTNPFSWPPCSGCSPLGRAGAPRRRRGGRAGTAGQAVPAEDWVWAGSQQLPWATLHLGQKNGSPRALVSWTAGLPRGRCREEPPAPPGSAPAARRKTTVRFVLSQATKRTGETPNFSSGATVPVIPFWGWQAQAPLCPRGFFTPG